MTVVLYSASTSFKRGPSNVNYQLPGAGLVDAQADVEHFFSHVNSGHILHYEPHTLV